MEPTTGGSLSAEDDASDVERKEVMALKFISSVCDRLTGMQEVPKRGESSHYDDVPRSGNSLRELKRGRAIRSGRGAPVLRTPQTRLRCSLVWGLSEAAKALKGKEEATGHETGGFAFDWQKRS